MTAKIALVAAVADNGVIGVRGGLPWRIRADLKKFRAITMGKPVIMGRKTFESIGRVLDGRDVIVVTRKGKVPPDGALVAANLESALKLAADRAAFRGAEEICVTGGGEIYAAALPLADRLYVTHVTGKPEGDTFFPGISRVEWSEVGREPLARSEGDTASGVHVVYARRH